MRLSRSLALLLPLALLAGCNNKPATNDRRSASGEVLQGTTSDAMLPLDKLKSQGPMLAQSKKKSTPKGQADAPEGVADEASGAADVASEASAAPDDAATASPAPAPSETP